MQFESKLQDIKDLKKRNKVFDALSNEDKRKEIAWDCFQLTLIGKVSGSLSGYWSDSLDVVAENLYMSHAFQKRLVDKLPECQVCARGGMMLSQIRLGNTVSPCDKYKDRGDLGNIKGFSTLSFTLMEREYENNWYEHPYKNNTTEKLQNICLNVIANGDFITTDKTDYVQKYLESVKTK